MSAEDPDTENALEGRSNHDMLLVAPQKEIHDARALLGPTYLQLILNC